MKKLLTDLAENKSAKIVELNVTDKKLACRFYELGLIVGQTIKVIKVASKRSAMLICVRGFTLALDSTASSMVVVDE